MVDDNNPPGWRFLTNHAHVLLCVAADPSARLRDIGDRVGITERAAHRIVTELTDSGYVTRERHGRRNRYTVNANSPLPDPVARKRNVGELLAIVSGADAPEAT